MSDLKQLTLHFHEKEFVCPCCGSLGSGMNKRLILALERFRVKINRPVQISSGYRCRRQNAFIGGSKNSRHLRGIAADIFVSEHKVQEDFGPDLFPGGGVVLMYLHALGEQEFYRGGIGVYNSHIHVDVRNTGSARWGYNTLRREGFTTLEEALRYCVSLSFWEETVSAI